jgi:hypothetical protein
VLEAREKTRQLQHAKAAVDAKNLELESRLLGDADRAENAELALQELKSKVGGAESRATKAAQELEAVRAQLAEAVAARTTAEARARDQIVAL